MRTLLFNILFIASMVLAQSNDYVAKAGNIEIDSKELEMRVNMTPMIKSHVSQDSIKYDMLYTIIAEKLWAQEAELKGLDETEYYRYSTKYVEGLLARDEFFKDEVLDKIDIPKKEIYDYSRRINLNYLVKYLYSKSEVEIKWLYDKLVNGENFDSLLTKRPERKYQEKPVEVKYGQMDFDSEDLIYALDKGEFSKPVLKDDNSWVIYFIVDKKIDIKEKIDSRREAQKMLDTKYRQKYYREFYENYMKDTEVYSDSIMVQKMIDHAYQIVRKLEKVKPNNSEPYYYLNDDGVRAFSKIFTKEELRNPFIKFNKKPVSVTNFLWEVSFDGIKIYEKDYKSVAAGIKHSLREYTRKEIIRRLAIAKNYHKRKVVVDELKIWQQSFLASQLRNRENSEVKVTEDEIALQYDKYKNSGIYVSSVDIAEIFTLNLDIVSICLDKINNGSDFNELIRQYSDKDYDDCFHINLDPEKEQELWRYTYTLNKGEVFGPIENNNGYSIVKVIEKHSDNDVQDGMAKTLESIKSELYFKKLANQIDDKTIELAKKYGVTIQSNQVDKVKFVNLPMLVYRYIGFGGKMNAVPVTPIFKNWYRKMKNSEKEAL